MIAGFNTDITFEGVTYHVQTEDKGLDNPLIISLVYLGGKVIASKRSKYGDIIADKFDEEVLAERLKRQHRLICAAIQVGRIEELKQMTAKNSIEPKKKSLLKEKSEKSLDQSCQEQKAKMIEQEQKAKMIEIVLNGEVKKVDDQINLLKLLEEFGLPMERIAIELNKNVVRRKEWEATKVAERDKIEVIHFVGGG